MSSASHPRPPAGMKDDDIPHAPAVPAPTQEEYEKVEVTFDAPDPGTVRGVLVYHRPADRRRKSVKWRQEDDLQEVFYFEMDETERGESRGWCHGG